LRIAGWEDDRAVWTGSCPCQPFSRAGKRKAQSDDRHLWPQWSRLIQELRPAIIFGEQVEAAIACGWLDEVANDLETKDYAFGASVLSTLAVEIPDNRERIFFVGNCEYDGWDGPKAVGGTTTSIHCSEEGENITIEPSGAGASRVLSYGDIQWKKYPHGKTKAVKPGICLLADGVPSRVAEIHALGNAINPEIAARFIRAVM
jgi:DNA (cytosine-5)-methyltransferase 1